MKDIVRTIKSKGAFVAGILMTSLLLSACAATKQSDKISVVSTTGMIHDAAAYIGGQYVDAVGLMGPGVDPHLYKASESDVRKLAGADIIFYNGLHLEAKMGEILEKMAARTKVVAVTDAIDRTKLTAPPEFQGFYDPHVWFDVMLWRQAVEHIVTGFTEFDPDHADYYRERGNDYLAQLDELDRYVRTTLARIPEKNRVLVTAHDAFGYFGKAYNLKVMGLLGISTEAEAGTQDVQRLAEFVAKEKIPAIFVESSIPERHIKAVQDAVKAKGWNVKIGGELFSDALGDAGTEAGTYIGMVKHNVNTITEALTQ